LQATIIDYTEDIKRAYGSVLQDIFFFALSWAYHSADEDVPNVVCEISNELKAINGFDALKSTLGLWRSMFLPSRRNLPLPSLERIIPAPHAYWNAVKSGSDTCTKLMDSCPIYVPMGCANLETKACSRIMMLCFVSIHRLRQVFSSKPLASNYGSLENYRHSARERSSFHHSILVCVNSFLEMNGFSELTGLRRRSDSMDDEDSHDEDGRRSQPIRKKVAGKVPKPLPFDFKGTNKTPKKAVVRQIGSGKAHTEVIERWNTCRGRPFQVIDDSKTGIVARKVCCMCNGRTSWMCLECHGWFCMHHKPEDEILYSVSEQTQQRVFYYQSCFSKKHSPNWKNN